MKTRSGKEKEDIEVVEIIDSDESDPVNGVKDDNVVEIVSDEESTEKETFELEDDDDKELSENDEENKEEAEIEGDDEYELTKSEGQLKCASEWKILLMESNGSSKNIRVVLESIKPYERSKKTGSIVVTTSLTNFFTGVVQYLNCGIRLNKQNLLFITKDILSCCDLLYGILTNIAKSVKSLENDTTWENLFVFLKNIPHPKSTVVPKFFKQKYHYLRSRSRNKLTNSYENLWFTLLNSKVPKKALLKFLPFISAHVLQNLREPHKTADFFFKVFDLGSSFSILALEAIFRLIVNHNFEYPNFYDKVYTLCTPNVFYTEHKQKFIELLDTFLSSSHVPLYIVAAFAKKLLQVLLLAPIDAEEPVLGLVRNLITRHPSISHLIHREIPQTFLKDPYEPSELLSKSNALETSLWELRTLKRHWHPSISKRAGFADKALQKTESFVRFRSSLEYFDLMMCKKYGSEADSESEKYVKAQEGSDEENEPATKRSKSVKGGKFMKKREVEQSKSIHINSKAPSGKFLPDNSFSFQYSNFFQG